jgi:protoheme IX farnesyltransferase
MAIAWMYRDQYRKGGLKMITVTEPTGLIAGLKSVVTAAMLIAVSLLPVLVLRTQVHVWIFVIASLLLGAYYFKAAWAFLLDRNDQVARQLLRASLLYLPAYMLVLILACLT